MCKINQRKELENFRKNWWNTIHPQYIFFKSVNALLLDKLSHKSGVQGEVKFFCFIVVWKFLSQKKKKKEKKITAFMVESLNIIEEWL